MSYENSQLFDIANGKTFRFSMMNEFIDLHSSAITRLYYKETNYIS